MAADPANNQKVLVVDDDPVFLRLVEKALEPAGISCLCVRSGEEALKLVVDRPPMALVVDGLLPGIRGDELAIRIRKSYPREQLPIVFISAFFRDMKSRIHLTKTCQVDLVLHKPITLEELRRAFTRVPRLAPAALPVLPSSLHTQAPAVESEGSGGSGSEYELDLTDQVALIAEYISAASEHVRAMRAALSALSSPNRTAALGLLRFEAHRFAGTGGLFGLPDVSRLGSAMEDLIEAEPSSDLTPVGRARLTGLVEALAAKIARAAAGTSAGDDAIAQTGALRVMLVDGPGDLSVSCAEAAGKGQPVQVVADAEAAQAALSVELPHVAFVAIDRADFDGLRAVEVLRRSGVRPVLAMAKDGSYSARREALQRGAEGFLHRLPDASAMWRIAAEYVRSQPGGKVLAVDVDCLELEALALALAPQGYDVEPCAEPRELFAALWRVSPGIVTVAADLGELSGNELVRALRSDAKFRNVPVLLLSKTSDAQARLEAFQAGADDVLPRPCAPEELNARVAGLMARRAREERVAVTDALTGAFRRSYLVEACERALHLARRGRPLAILAFDADVESIGRQLGALAVEEAVAAIASRLRQSFRVSDVLARLGEGRFAVLLHDVTEESAEQLLRVNLEALHQSTLGPAVPISVRGAMATFPEVGGGAEALLAAALAGLAVKTPQGPEPR